MAEWITDGGFEAGDPAWTYASGASRSALGARTGSWGGRLLHRYGGGGFGPPDTNPEIAQVLPPEVNSSTSRSFWVDGSQADVGFGGLESRLSVQLYYSGGWTQVQSVAAGAGWQQITLDPFPSGTSGIRFRTNRVSGVGLAYWSVDDVSVNTSEAVMAVLLEELARKSLLKTMQDNLPAVLVEIVAERADGLALPAVGAWFSYNRDMKIVDQTQLEVYRNGSASGASFPDSVTFPNWEREQSAILSGDPNAWLHSTCFVCARITHANRDNLAAGQMQDRTDRYGAALIRVVRDNPTLGDDRIVARPLRMTISQGGDRQNKLRAERVEIVIACNLIEGKQGEGDASGGVAPTVTADQF